MAPGQHGKYDRIDANLFSFFSLIMLYDMFSCPNFLSNLNYYWVLNWNTYQSIESGACYSETVLLVLKFFNHNSRILYLEYCNENSLLETFIFHQNHYFSLKVHFHPCFCVKTRIFIMKTRKDIIRGCQVCKIQNNRFPITNCDSSNSNVNCVVVGYNRLKLLPVSAVIPLV